MNLSVAFQGGGAKLLELMAAAEACRSFHEDEKDPIKVMRLSGTSAGAIAAAMIATGCDIKKVIKHHKTFRAVIKDKFPKNRISLRRSLPRILLGQTIYRESDVHKLIEDMFSIGGVDASKKINELVKPGFQLRLVRSNIKTNSADAVDETASSKLSNVLVESAAIPFAFRMPMKNLNDPEILDGGLFQNLPVREAVKSIPTDWAPLAFSFEDDAAVDLASANFHQYASAVLSSLLAENIDEAIMDIDPDNVITLPSKRSLFDFEHMLSDDSIGFFDDETKIISTKIDAWRNAISERDGPDWHSIKQRDLLAHERHTTNDIIQFYDKVAYDFHATEIHHEVSFQSHNERIADIYRLEITLDGNKNEGMQFLKLTFYDSDRGFLARAKIEGFDDKKQPIELLAIPMRHSTTPPRNRSVFICLPKPLSKNDKVKIVKTEESFLGMEKYNKDGYIFETIGIGAQKSADLMKITVHFPTDRPKYYDNASKDGGHPEEIKELNDETGVQILADTRMVNGLVIGCDTVQSTVAMPEKCDHRRFVKIAYGKRRL